jgi:hypothetical protein
MKYLIVIATMFMAACVHSSQQQLFPPNKAVEHQNALQRQLNGSILRQECLDVFVGACQEDPFQKVCQRCLKP